MDCEAKEAGVYEERLHDRINELEAEVLRLKEGSGGFYDIERMKFESEEYQCAMMFLDDIKAPTGDDKGKFSLVGRIRSVVAKRDRMIDDLLK